MKLKSQDAVYMEPVVSPLAFAKLEGLVEKRWPAHSSLLGSSRLLSL